MEFGGIYKNVIAIAAGMIEGAGMGANARAALITRGLAELQKFVVKEGGNPLTVAGLSGVGDLVATCTSGLSRNQRVGVGLAEGKTLEEITSELGQVAEGVNTTKRVVALAEKLNISVPIAEQVECVLDGKRSVKESVADLLSRAPSEEFSSEV